MGWRFWRGPRNQYAKSLQPWLYSLMPAACHQDSQRWAQRTIGTHAQKDWEEAPSELFFLIDPELDFSKALVSFNSGHWGRATFHVRTIAFYMKYTPHLHGSEGLPTGSSICTPGIHLIGCVPTLGQCQASSRHTINTS